MKNKSAILVFILSYGYLHSFSQFTNTRKFVLAGQVIGRDTGFISLKYITDLGKFISDTTYLLNGKFEFTGNIKEPVSAWIQGYENIVNFQDANNVRFFLEPKNQSIILEENNYQKCKMDGSVTQKESDTLKKEIDSVYAKYQNLYNEFNEFNQEFINTKDASLKLTLKQKADSMHSKLEFPQSVIRTITNLFIIHHPDSYVSINYLNVNDLSYDSSVILFDALSPRVKNSDVGKYRAMEIEKKRRLLPNKIAPNFTAISIQNQNINLAMFKGNTVLLDFWASWCIPCRKSFPQLKVIYNKYKNKGLKIIAIADDDRSPNEWKKAIKQDKIEDWYHVLKGSKKLNNGEIDTTNSINNKYDIHFLPTRVLINSDGIIVGSFVGLSDESDAILEKRLQELLK